MFPRRCWTKRAGMKVKLSFNSLHKNSCWNCSIRLFADGKFISFAFLSQNHLRHKPLQSSMLKTSPKLWQPARWAWTHWILHHPQLGVLKDTLWPSHITVHTYTHTWAQGMLDTHLLVWGPRCTSVSGGSRCFNSSTSPWGISYQASVPGHSGIPSRNSSMTQANLWRQRFCSCVTGGNTYWPLPVRQAGKKKNFLNPSHDTIPPRQKWKNNSCITTRDGAINTGRWVNHRWFQEWWREPSWARLAGSAKGKHFGRNSRNQFI